jgi:glutamate-ammonia-ligase adenylyltransferase
LAHIAKSADPELALVNLTRWLGVTSNPQALLLQMEELDRIAELLISLFGASQHLADLLIQNSELASIALDPNELRRPLHVSEVVSEGRAMAASAISYRHGLDRLRFLKQRWTLPIVVNDLAGEWAEEAVWMALSDLAEALIALAATVAWKEFAKSTDLPEECPIMVVGFGKLGGRELNFSSDVDLVYATEDGLDESLSQQLTRFCEMFGRALSDRMGRGSLFRVDLRLRPYGNSGALAPTMRAIENYYRLYAEQWEIQALIRSRPMIGSPALRERWAVMRTSVCFREQLSEVQLEAMLAMKTRIEERADTQDIKRGAGGIRDVEFLVQCLQLLHGHGKPNLQVEPTLTALRELEQLGFLSHAAANGLTAGYTFLRQFEHRCQLVGDQQTHSVPSDDLTKHRIARLMGRSSWAELNRELDMHRRAIQSLYSSILHPSTQEESARSRVAAKIGEHAPTILPWFDSFPESEAFYESLDENEGSLSRVLAIANEAPRLISEYRQSVGLTEELMSGEVEEESDSVPTFEISGSDRDLARQFLVARTRLLANWTLTRFEGVEEKLTDLNEALLRTCLARVDADFNVVGLGSFGNRSMGPESDFDLLFLVANPALQASAELTAQSLLGIMNSLRRSGAPVSVDLRLRPDGSKGMLVRSYDAIRTYADTGMDTWERFAMAQARVFQGDDETKALVAEIAMSTPLTRQVLEELLAMKNRIETERVKPAEARSHLKLGPGGLSDIEWLVTLGCWSLRSIDPQLPMADRIQLLSNEGLLSTDEAATISLAYRYLVDLRFRSWLMGFDSDRLPESPEKLERLGSELGIAEPQDFAKLHNQTIDAVRAIYIGALERLKA